MNIRTVTPEDMDTIRRIHKLFYEGEFNFPETHYLSAFIIEEDGVMITTGGIRLITELIAVTNKDISVKKRREALVMLLQASSFVCDKLGYEHIHAFVQDENWYNQLIKRGFHTPKGKALIYG